MSILFIFSKNHLLVILIFIKSEQAGTVFPTLLLTTNLRNKETLVYRDHEITGSQDHEFTSLIQTDSAFAALDSIPLMRTAKWFATIATTGYIPTGSFLDIGHIEEILQVNQHEGVHVGLPFRTNAHVDIFLSLFSYFLPQLERLSFYFLYIVYD